jgi:hypothetical protein
MSKLRRKRASTLRRWESTIQISVISWASQYQQLRAASALSANETPLDPRRAHGRARGDQQ